MSALTQYITPKKMFHAYGIEGEKNTLFDNVQSLLKDECGVSIEGNPDYHALTFESLGITEARQLIEISGKLPFAGDKKYFVVTFDRATHEAQNALLKLFEDRDVQEIVDQTLRCKSIVSDLLEFSRQSVGKASSFSLEGLITKTLNLLINQALFQDIEVMKDIQADMPGMVGDMGQFQQVLTNLFIKTNHIPFAAWNESSWEPLSWRIMFLGHLIK